MTKRNFILFGVVILLMLISLSSVLAITASMGNSRMVLRLSPGETIEKSILIKNVNNVTLNINLSVSGDLENNVELREESFILNAGEEKKAYFTIKAQNDENTTETRINVAYNPLEGKGVGLSANIIVITSGDVIEDSEDNQDDLIEDSDNSDVGSDNKLSGTAILLISTAVLILILLIILIVYLKKERKGVRRARDK